mgnify:CR=1 FL=1
MVIMRNLVVTKKLGSIFYIHSLDKNWGGF